MNVRLQLPFIFILFVATLLAYVGIYENTFLFDDEFLIQKNRFIRAWDHLPSIFSSSSTAGFGGVDSFYRPLQTSAYLLTYQLFGLSTAAFHGLNILLHVGNVCLVFLLGQKLGFKLHTVFIATLLWTLHPLHTEAITYMSATADPLHVTFLLCGLLAFDKVRLGRQLLSLFCFALALLSKEAAIVFPALLALILFYKDDLAHSIKSWPAWLLAAFYLVARATVLDFDDSYRFYPQENLYTQNILIRFYSALATLPDYFALILAPHDLHMERELTVAASFFLPPVLLGAALASASAAFVFYAFRKKNTAAQPFAFGLLWFYAAFFPCSGILVPMNALFLEHWMYLPTIGLFLGTAESVARCFQALPKRFFYGLGTVMACLLGILTFQQNKIWRDPITFYEHILKYEPGSARVHNNLAMALTDQSKIDKAMSHYLKAIATSDTYPQTHHNLALLYLHKQEADMAIVHFKRALELQPDFYQSAGYLAEIYTQSGEPDLAAPYIRLYDTVTHERLK